MSRSMLLSFAATLMVCGCAPAGPAPEADTSAADEAVLQEQIAAFDAAVHAEDIEAMMTRYHANAVRLNPNVPPAIGIAAIRQLFLDDWAANDFEVKNELTEVHVDGDLAAGRGIFTVRVIPADGSEPYENSGNWSSVWQRQADGSWKALWDIWNSDLPLGPVGG